MNSRKAERAMCDARETREEKIFRTTHKRSITRFYKRQLARATRRFHNCDAAAFSE